MILIDDSSPGSMAPTCSPSLVVTRGGFAVPVPAAVASSAGTTAQLVIGTPSLLVPTSMVSMRLAILPSSPFFIHSTRMKTLPVLSRLPAICTEQSRTEARGGRKASAAIEAKPSQSCRGTRSGPQRAMFPRQVSTA